VFINCLLMAFQKSWNMLPATKLMYHLLIINHLFSIPEIHHSGYRTCHWITTGIIQNESWQ
jgi:hypothetical protein